MDNENFTSKDIVNFAAQKDAVKLSAAFDQMVGQRVYDAIEARKKEVANIMFNNGEEQQAEEGEDTESVEQEGEVSIEASADQPTEDNTEPQIETEEPNETAEQDS